ncbi:hypothetical protein [Pseudomonas spirodelae]|uniref:Secreted protein with PEP-CTERM sorting signal n=1 Tax=Pseudomonas spirodelae TaxID=3101751 RepID=A0ABU5P4X1_9PSED|nr:hypothetical protein [Pseudomonas sp. T5W1]MEA1604707.1 hypothetical protein [Pseudomonas sp. T5W1]
MRLVLLTKSLVLLLLLNGASVSCAQAAGSASESEQARNILHRSDLYAGVPFSFQSKPARLPSISAIGLLSTLSREHDVQSLKGEWLLRDEFSAADKSSGFLGVWAGAGSIDRMIAVLVESRLRVGLNSQGIGLIGPSVIYTAQPNTVPLPAAAWLFASALFGFIVVASRRKV